MGYEGVEPLALCLKGRLQQTNKEEQHIKNHKHKATLNFVLAFWGGKSEIEIRKLGYALLGGKSELEIRKRGLGPRLRFCTYRPAALRG